MFPEREETMIQEVHGDHLWPFQNRKRDNSKNNEYKMSNAISE